MKRIFDFSLALIGLFISLPFWFIFSFSLWLKDGRPIFYIQERVGLGGGVFKLIKFCTMDPENRERSKFANFLRKTALDELPQLINILKGEMSFVGPRPLVSEEIKENQAVNFRSMIRPGLTGTAQISVSRDYPILEKLKYDLWYIENQSLWLDIRIIVLSLLRSLGLKWDR